MERKEIVKVLGEHFEVKPKYMGVPSFAYQVETEGEIYTIDRVGKITNAEGVELELEAILNPAVEEENGEPTEAYEISVPIAGHTGISLRNLVNMIYSKQEFIQKALGIAESIIIEDFIKAINEAKIETLEDFQKAIEGKRNCIGIEFDFEEQRIIFKFIEGESDSEKQKAYNQFVALINETAKTLKHASTKVSSNDNPKFTFRVFLIRLGMIGDEYKTARKILLEKLEGNAAFRYGKPEKKIEEPTREQ